MSSSFIDDALRGYRKVLICIMVLVALPILIPIELALKPADHYFNSWDEPNGWDVTITIGHAKAINVDDDTVHVQILDPSRADRRYLIWAEGWKQDGHGGLVFRPDSPGPGRYAFIADLTYHHLYPHDENKRYNSATHYDSGMPVTYDRDSNGDWVIRTQNPKDYTINSFRIIPVAEDDARWEAKLGRTPSAWPAVDLSGDVKEAR